uniref:Transposase n=1 Tax=Loa loa TaxID=7209 RepID=A0A1I7V8S6_LOALO
MRQDILCVNDEELRFCFEQNCAYGLWQTQRHLYDQNIWPIIEVQSPRGNPNADCDWINAQFYNLITEKPLLTVKWIVKLWTTGYNSSTSKL